MLIPTTNSPGRRAASERNGSSARASAAPRAAVARSNAVSGFADAKADFGCKGDASPLDGSGSDDTAKLQTAIDTCRATGKILWIPPGRYKISSPLNVTTQVTIMGANSCLGFSTYLVPHACAAFNLGANATQSWHNYIGNLMIWPYGAAGAIANALVIDHSYSCVFENLYFNGIAATDAVILCRGHADAGGNGPSNNIIWNNIIIRKGSAAQDAIGFKFTKDAGSHTLNSIDVEACGVGLKWGGGRITVNAPYMETCGVFSIEAIPVDGTQGSSMVVNGGLIGSAASGIPLALKAGSKNLQTYGTRWDGAGDYDIFIYSATPMPNVNIHGWIPDERTSGVANWDSLSGVRFPDAV